MRVILSPKAKADFRHILQYRLDNEGKKRAQSILKSFNNSFENLELNPLLGNPFSIPDFDIGTRRLIVHRTYSIIYRIYHQKITILRIWHNSRNPKQLGE